VGRRLGLIVSIAQSKECQHQQHFETKNIQLRCKKNEFYFFGSHQVDKKINESKDQRSTKDRKTKRKN